MDGDRAVTQTHPHVARDVHRASAALRAQRVARLEPILDSRRIFWISGPVLQAGVRPFCTQAVEGPEAGLVRRKPTVPADRRLGRASIDTPALEPGFRLLRNRGGAGGLAGAGGD